MSASHLQTLRAMAHNNAWANHRLLTACASLTQAESTAPATGFFIVCAGEAPLRQPEFADLGWTEATVWPAPISPPA